MTRILGSSRSAIVASRRVRRLEHAGPLVERQIAGDDGGAALVALAEDLEQQLGAGCRKGYIAEFINDQQLVTGQLALQSQQTLLVFGLDQLMDQSGGRDQIDR